MDGRDSVARPGQEQFLVEVEPPSAVGVEGVDPVLTSLDQAAARYREARARWERELAELGQARARQDELTRQAEQARKQLAQEQKRARHYKERTQHLAEALKNIHRALFDGNVFGLILKACLTITRATRGLYVTAWGDGNFRVRAAVDIDGYPEAPPSDFIRGLCAEVKAEGKTLVANDPGELAAHGRPARQGEAFHNCLVAPAVLLKHFSGIVFLADKLDGPFDADDVEVVLSVGEQAAVAVENQHLQQELLHSYFAMVGALGDAVEAKDPYTHGHCELVARYARLTARRMGLPEADQSVVCYGGLLHDVGKIGVSDGVLHKPGRLMPEEWDLMRSHVRVGHDILSHVPVLGRIADVVLHHHERYDGGGYPDGLRGETISLPARIVCVADAYCAMISRRSYKESFTPEQARAELLRHRGTQFDPAVVDAFLAVLDAEEPEDDCPDGCGLPPHFLRPEDLKKVVETVQARKG